MNQEALFTQKLNELTKLAKDQGGYVTQKQVIDAFETMNFNSDQLQMVFDYLLKHKIGLDEPLDLDDYLTDEEKNYLDDYLQELKELPVVSDGEKEAITLSAMAGDVDAQMKLIEVFLPDVVEIAKLYSGQGVLMEDLIGEGNLALTMGTSMLGCLEHAGEAQGMLGKMIMDAMEEIIAQRQEEEKADLKAADKINKVMEQAKELSEQLRRKVTVEELASETKLSEKAIRDAIYLSGNQIEYLEEEQ